MPEPLLPGHYPTEPFFDASAVAGEPARLRSIADELGYLYLRHWIRVPRLEAVRAFVRSFALAHRWIEPAKGNPPVLRARRGAGLAGRGWDDPAWIELQRDLAGLPAFAALVRCREIVGVLEAVYDEPAAVATANHCWIKLPGSPEFTTRPHRDSFYLPGCKRMWTVWVPLSHTPMNVGPLGVIAGSHRTGLWPQHDAMAGIAVPRNVTWATAAVEPGDAVFFGPDTIHCAWSNVSAHQVRVSLDLRYEPASTTGSILRPGGGV